MTANTLPLAGVRVIDLGIAWAGAFCGRVLADLGAEVIKVESRRRLDLRGPAKPPPGSGAYPDGDPGNDPWNRSAVFHERHRNKLSVTLELDRPEGRDVFLRLVSQAHVVSENFSPRVLKNFGLDYGELHKVNPGLIMVSMSGFGQTGPQRDYVAFGDTLEQITGSSSITGYIDGPPMNSGLHYPDPVVGALAAGLIISALREQRATGKGSYVDMAQVEVVRWMLGHMILGAQVGSDLPNRRYGNRHPWLAPQGCFPCRGNDAWVVLTVQDDDQWALLARKMDRPDLSDRFPTVSLRRGNLSEIEEAIATWTRSRPASEVVEACRTAGIPACEVLEVPDLFQNEQLTARGFFDEHPIEGGTPCKVLGGVWQFDGKRLGLRRPAPKLGEHNVHVLKEICGLSDVEIRDLESKGVIGTMPAELEE